MNDHPEHIFSLDPHKHEEEIIRATAEQIKKDFSEFSINIFFTGKDKSPYDELYDQLTPVIEDLLKNKKSKLAALLYRIDVPEALLKKEALRQPDLPFEELITDLVIRRELKKVLYRKYYR
jgi:hypothetical protein